MLSQTFFLIAWFFSYTRQIGPNKWQLKTKLRSDLFLYIVTNRTENLKNYVRIYSTQVSKAVTCSN
jgi:hypothetical protein